LYDELKKFKNFVKVPWFIHLWRKINNPRIIGQINNL
jgi:hypothetical protein